MLLSFAVIAPSTAQPGTLFGSTGSASGELITLDTATGDGTLRCPFGDIGPVTEIEFRDDGVLFATTGQGFSSVLRIDPTNCDESLVGIHPYGAVNALEFVGTTLYGAFYDPGGEAPQGSPTSLVIVNTSDGSLTPIGAMGFSPVRGLAYDVATQTMYGTGSPLQGGDMLFTVNLATAGTTPIGPHGVNLGGLELGPDGLLYGGQRGGGGGAAPEGAVSAGLFTVNPATGQATVVGPTGFPAISGLSFQPEGGEPALAIPTLSAANLAMLGATLLAAGWLVLRRRSAKT